MDKFKSDEIKAYWTNQAKTFGESHKASWSDLSVIEMEINEIQKWIQNEDTVLDVGCANGYATIQYAINKNINILGIDYIPEMISSAKKILSQADGTFGNRVSFDVGNILNLTALEKKFKKIIVTRVLINLGNWKNQKKALMECGNSLETGGLLILSEATRQGWEKLNKFRKEWGLPKIPEPPFNNYLDEQKIIETLDDQFEMIRLINFASTYFVGTRIIKPLLIKSLGIDIDVADPDMEWNRWLAQLPAWGDYGTQKLFVFQKKE